jgi:hypothetical protein
LRELLNLRVAVALDAHEEPRRERRHVEPRTLDDLLDVLPLHVAIGDHTQSFEQLVDRLGAVRHGERFAHLVADLAGASRHRGAERPLGEHQREHDPDRPDGARDGEHGRRRVRECLGAGELCARRRRKLGREQRAERRGANGAADESEERRAGRSDSEVRVIHGILYGDHEHLHHQPHAESEHEHEQRCLHARGVCRHA